MNYLRLSALALLLGCATGARAGDVVQTNDASASAAVAPEGKKWQVSYELEANYGYVGSSETELDHHRTGGVTEQSTEDRLVLTPQYGGEGPIYRFGLALQRFSFGLPNAAPLPNSLQSLSAVVGMDVQVFNSWLVRLEATPGLYGDFHDARGNDFNVPVVLAGSYIAGANLQWVVAVSLDLNRQYPVLPILGMRWSIADQWTLNAVLPSPRLEYAATPKLTLYVGADLKDGAFRVDESFGTAHGHPRLNNAIVEYDEIRVGAGASWKVSSGMTLEMEAGALPYRQFNFYRANSSYSNEDMAPYGQVSFSAKF